jgi:hypothetical protein
MIRYCFKDQPVTIKNVKDADPQAIGEAISELVQKYDGKIVKDEAIDECRRRSHPLNKHFEWNDKKAGVLYRRDQMRELARCVRIVNEDAGPPEIAFVSIYGPPGGHAYHRMDEVIDSTDLQLGILRSAQRDLNGWLKRYNSITAVCDLVHAATEQLEKLIRKADRRGSPPKYDGDGSRPTA